MAAGSPTAGQAAAPAFRKSVSVAMRPTAEQAMVRVQEYIDFLETSGVPTALFKERVQAVHAWGKSVRFRQPDAAQPRSEEMKRIQRALDEAVASENFVRENRKRCPSTPTKPKSSTGSPRC